MSLRHSIHIGVSPANLQLSPVIALPPADENMAKGECAKSLILLSNFLLEASRSRIESTEVEQREYEDEGMYNDFVSFDIT